MLLVALDICSFSENIKLKDMQYHRGNLFQAVKAVPGAHELVSECKIEMQFIGDELRFAFPSDIGDPAKTARDFVKSVFLNLEPVTMIRGVVLQCDLIWREFFECRFFDGPAAVMCSEWLDYAEDNEVLINKAFKISLETEMLPSNFEKCKCGLETGFVLPVNRPL